MTPCELLICAEDAMVNSYSPYSGFSVGAALITAGGRVYKGCNIENSAFSPTICAERTAFFKAISEGENDFEAIAIVGKIQKRRIQAPLLSVRRLPSGYEGVLRR